MFKKRPIRRKVKRVVRRTKRPTVSQAVKKYVKRTINANTENKGVNINSGANFGTVLESTDMNMYPMLPYTGLWTIGQGITAASRIGNQIKIRKVMLNYVLRPTPYDAISNLTTIPQEVDMFLGYTKQLPGLQPVAGDLAALFQSGSSSTGPVGSLRDLVSTVNTDYWHISKRWRHKIGYAASTGTGGNAGNQFFSNNDFKLNVVNKLDITKFCPKTVTFNDGNNTPQGRNLFFFYQSIRADGQVGGATQLPCNIEFWIDFRYEDA